MNDLKKRLKKKGWTNEDIHKAVKIINSGKLKKSKKIVLLESIIHNIWILMFLAIIGNFIISIILMPFIVSMQSAKLYIVIVVIGLAFGAFFDMLIRDMKNIKDKDLIIPAVFFLLITIINISLIVKLSNYFQRGLGLGGFQHSPILVSVVYVVAFILPYAVKSTILCKK